MSNPTLRRTLPAVVGLAAVLLLTACSTGSSPSAGSSATASGTTAQQAEKYWADVDKCFAAAGFDPEKDVTPDAPDAARKAWDGCVAKAGPNPGAADLDDPAQIAADRAAGIAYDKCFRDLGYAMPASGPDGALQEPENATKADIDTCMTKQQDAFDEALATGGQR